jgi:hypothetical protein
MKDCDDGQQQWIDGERSELPVLTQSVRQTSGFRLSGFGIH